MYMNGHRTSVVVAVGGWPAILSPSVGPARVCPGAARSHQMLVPALLTWPPDGGRSSRSKRGALSLGELLGQ